MRKKLLLLSIVITFMLGACAEKNSAVADAAIIEKENETVDEDSNKEASQIESETVDNTNENKPVPCSYESIIEEIKKGLEDPEAFFDRDNEYPFELSCAVSRCVILGTWYDLGYLQEDIDGDGIEEMLVGIDDSDGDISGGNLMCLFTLQNGQPYPVVLKGDRDEYQLCENNIIKQEYYYATPSRGVNYYKYEKGKLELIECINGEYDFDRRKFQYYYTTDDSGKNPGRELTEKEADDIIEEFEARYKKRKIQVHLF